MTDCNHDYRIVEGHQTCINCGEVDIDRAVFSESIQPVSKQYFIYYRKSYFREKLRLLTGIKQSMSDEYVAMVEQLKQHKFNTIQELKKLMQKLGYHRFYKNIYVIYFDIKGIKLINLTCTQIDFLTNQFLKIEHVFKTKYPDKSNLLSYNILIYLLLQKYYPEYYKQVLLPKNFRKIVKNIEELLNNSEIY